MSERRIKIQRSSGQLNEALVAYHARSGTGSGSLQFLALAKAFEILFEYVWKELKFKIEDEGLFANSPKETIRQAAKLGLITEAEQWIDCANARNDSVHDYFGIPEPRYVQLVKQFADLVTRVNF